MFDKIFSMEKIENSLFGGLKLKILGIKISFKKLNFKKLVYRQNCNLISIVFNNIKLADSKDLFCLRNDKICFIFNKNITAFGYKNFCDYVMNCMHLLRIPLTYSMLDYDSEMYKEHAERLANNEFLWKYVHCNGKFLHKYLSIDENNQIFVHEQLMDESFAKNPNNGVAFIPKNSKRPFIKGNTVRQYLENESIDTKKEILVKLLDYVFEKYAVGNGMISGTLYDCHWGNFIIDENKNFYFIDDELVSPKPLKKEYVIKYLLRSSGEDEVLEYLLEHYGIKSSKNKNIKKSNFVQKNKKSVAALKYFIH